ncbi:hypothetical protein QF001_000666 [Paraburkholderia youngii]
MHQPVQVTVAALCDELRKLWQCFDHELRQGKLKHLDYDAQHSTLTWRKPKADKNATQQESFYAKLRALRDIADIIRFVNERCGFLLTMTPLQPRYAKKIADADSLMAVIIAQATNLGNLAMSRPAISRITHSTKHIASTAVWPHCGLPTTGLPTSSHNYRSSSTTRPILAHFSVPSTDRSSLPPLRPQRRGTRANISVANGESSPLPPSPISYHNTTDIAPTIITGDMHSINKMNFAAMYWFEMDFAPRFTNLQAQLKHLFCGDDIEQDDNFLIKPAGQIDLPAICDDPCVFEQIIASLSMKEMSQQALVRKLCALSPHHRTRRAVFEFGKLVRSIYTLRYMRDPQLQRNVHRPQNRIEAYHALRGFIAEVSGRKHLIGKTDHDIAINNECGRLLANVVTAFNSVLLSQLNATNGREMRRRSRC